MAACRVTKLLAAAERHASQHLRTPAHATRSGCSVVAGKAGRRRLSAFPRNRSRPCPCSACVPHRRSSIFGEPSDVASTSPAATAVSRARVELPAARGPERRRGGRRVPPIAPAVSLRLVRTAAGKSTYNLRLQTTSGCRPIKRLLGRTSKIEGRPSRHAILKTAEKITRLDRRQEGFGPAAQGLRLLRQLARCTDPAASCDCLRTADAFDGSPFL